MYGELVEGGMTKIRKYLWKDRDSNRFERNPVRCVEASVSGGVLLWGRWNTHDGLRRCFGGHAGCRSESVMECYTI